MRGDTLLPVFVVQLVLHRPRVERNPEVVTLVGRLDHLFPAEQCLVQLLTVPGPDDLHNRILDAQHAGDRQGEVLHRRGGGLPDEEIPGLGMQERMLHQVHRFPQAT